MDWLCLLLDMWGSNQLRSVFEEGVLAHQPVDGALVVGIRIFSEASPFFCDAAVFFGRCARTLPAARCGRPEEVPD
jgi:hypothetical protein